MLFDQQGESVEASTDGVEAIATEVGIGEDPEGTFVPEDGLQEDLDFYAEGPQFYAEEDAQYGENAWRPLPPVATAR